MKSPHGGKRANAGKKKGTKWPSTIAKDAAREETRQYLTERLKPVLRAHVANAQGIGHLYTRDKAGKFTKIESEAEIDRLLVEGIEGTNYWIFTKDPSTQSFAEILNRSLDKAKEQEQEIKITGEADLIARLLAGRKRAAAAKRGDRT